MLLYSKRYITIVSYSHCTDFKNNGFATMLHYSLLFLHLVQLFSGQDIVSMRSASFSVVKNSNYHPLQMDTLLDSRTIKNLKRCASTCVQNVFCQTAAYHTLNRSCLLYSESYGSLISATETSVIQVNIRNPLTSKDFEV